MQFICFCKEYVILCDFFQLFFGYIFINGKCYVFNWNYDKVLYFKMMSQEFYNVGIYLVVNIKLCLLQDYFCYNEVVE